MAEVFVARQPELKDGDRRIVKTRRGEIGVFSRTAPTSLPDLSPTPAAPPARGS